MMPLISRAEKAKSKAKHARDASEIQVLAEADDAPQSLGGQEETAPILQSFESTTAIMEARGITGLVQDEIKDPGKLRALKDCNNFKISHLMLTIHCLNLPSSEHVTQSQHMHQEEPAAFKFNRDNVAARLKTTPEEISDAEMVAFDCF
ncbi:unnamed protein product [Diplocarpon coronariae]